MSDKTKILRTVGNMKRAVTMPIVQQRLDESMSLEEGEVWAAYTEAKVKGQPGGVAVTSQRLILLSEGEIVAVLPNEAINIVSIVSQANGQLMGFFYDIGDLQSEVVLPTEEQAMALLELIAEARGTYPFESPKIYPRERGSSEIAVTMEPPYVTLSKPKRDVLGGEVRIKFPNQCAWCGSEQVMAARRVRLYAPNPGYTSGVGRALKQATGMAVGGALGGALGAGMGSAVLGPADFEKIKGVALNIAVPHCANHAGTSPEGVLKLVSAGLVGGATCRIQVRDAEYAVAIARANMGQPRPWQAPSAEQLDEQVERSMSAREVRLPTVRGLIWPDQCIVCGTPNPTEHYQANVIVEGSASQDEIVKVPICRDDDKKLRRSEVACGTVLLTGLLVTVALGWLTLVLLGDHMSGLVRWGMALLVGAVGYGIWAWGLSHIARRKLGVDALTWKPVKVTMEDGQYLLEFYTAEMAKVVRQANGLPEPPE